MLSWYAKPPLDVFAAQVDEQADKLRSLNDITKPGKDNIAMQIALVLGEAYLTLAKSFSPVDTGLLRKEHQLGQEELFSSANSVTASVIVDINPNAPQNIKWGGYPIVYGAEYHAERFQWFALATQAIEPLVKRVSNEMFNAYIVDLWNS